MIVKNTQKIWDQIKSSIDSMFSKRLADAENISQYGMSEDALNKLIFKSVISDEELAMVNKLGDKFFHRQEEIYVRIPQSYRSDNYFLHYKIPFATPQFIPAGWSASYRSSEHPICHDKVVNEVFFKRYTAWKAIQDERDQMISSTKAVFDATTTVNQLMKLWPPIQNLLPADVIERVNQKKMRDPVKRAKAENPELDTIVQNLSVDLLKARITA